ncbi:nitrate reductase molybdenum cofactor assembly chaperone [Streptomyces griseoflavus]|uniref:nitrate reductase molybdenum cofactor assembly chaperone n=1 Tax=Streptomyces griseoflavus TaxID=35619 RepID=UPI00167EBE3B|nr:nitrate reductase molybdenum cofactor assembly chaperone [Streptomyces griseoflavus]GGV40543.1 nitrate reductase molybdenum cofactor assembly chaperone [Streptomyces griseoflavus]
MRNRRTLRPAHRVQPWHTYAWQVQSLLLGYPDADQPGHLSMARRAAPALPAEVRTPLLRFVGQAEDTGTDALAAAYVATFDHRRRCCPYLTYYAHGDTRRRGLALVRLKQTYARAGWRLTDDELPDHLAVVLEFAATEPATGLRLLTGHRAGLELLRLALRDDDAPWAALLESVSATLPPLAGDERDAVARLAAEGPPGEQVGLDPYAPLPYPPAPSAGGPR